MSGVNRRRSGLGSGLDALFSGTETHTETAVRELPIETIQPNPHQPRTVFDEQALDELAASIREHGLIQPIIVSEETGGSYEIIAGERRWRAAQRAGKTTIPVIVREAAPQQLLELALIENVQRADLNALEEARAYQTLVDDFALTDGEIARRLGKGSREAIANTRRLLQLDPEAQDALLKGKLTAGHGRAILKVKDHERQRTMVQAIIEHELSVRAAEKLADLVLAHDDPAAALRALQGQTNRQAGPKSQTPKASPAPRSISADDDEVRRALEQILGTPVTFTRTDKELRVTIAFHSEEKLQEFYEWLSR